VIHLADAYVGDFSSIGYDFLSVQKPLFFLETHHGEIYSCGKKLASKESWVKVIGEWNDTDEWKEKRAKLYEKVFGQPRSTDAMIADLEKALRKPRPSWLSQSLDRFIL
jgi:CDP-glycerol glycerophosphotransferase (TagB/SpsB family)